MDHGHSLGILNQVDGFWVYLVLFLLILIQECGVPFPVLPSEVVLLGGGFMASQNKVTLVFAGLLATGATLIGNSLLFLVGRHFGRSALDRYGKYIHLRPDRVDRIEAWIERRGTPILIYGPLVPLLRAYIPALAGMFGVPFRYYISVLVGAALIWTFGLLILGQVLGRHWFDAVTFLRQNMHVGILIAVLIAVVTLAIIRWRRGMAHARAQQQAAHARARQQPERVIEHPAPPPRSSAGRVQPTGKPTDL